MTKQWQWQVGLTSLVILAASSSLAEAGKVPVVRFGGQRSSGTRTDLTVPYTTNGDSAFGAYFVAPRILASPIVDDPDYRQTKRVFNLPFQGAIQAFGGQFNGATERKPR